MENQAAVGDETPVGRVLKRLQSEGLDRHDAVHIPVAGPSPSEELQVLSNGKRPEDAPTLWNEADTHPRNRMRGRARNIFFLEEDLAATRRREPHDRADSRRLADSIPAQ